MNSSVAKSVLKTSQKRADHLSHPKYRADIDGLRAVAILPVVLYHAFPQVLTGGFIGVDIFFVISGFLISSIIFENLDKDRFSFSEFYVRRVKRIFPALLLVLAACYSFGWFALLADEYRQLGKHIAAGAGFVSNLLLIGEADYFDPAGETKPLLHLWSLGIEEQYYIVWPLFVWLLWKKRLALIPTIIVFALASFAINIFEVHRDIAVAFYSPQTRFWELLCGSLLAWFFFSTKNTGERIWSNTASISGAILIACGLWFINPEMRFPGAWAALPVFGTSLLIYAGPKAVVNRYVLSNPLMKWFGWISFPLYLWHWPLLAFARMLYGATPSMGVRIGLMIASVVLAWITYQFVEQPIRFGKRKVPAATLVVPTVVIALVGYWASVSSFMPAGARKAYESSIQIGWQLPVGTDEQSKWCNDMFPERAHLGATLRNDNFCILEKKNVPPNVLLIGDSGNLSLFPGLENTPGANLLVLSASAAAPFYDTRSTEIDDTIRLNNYRLTNQSIDYAISAKNIKVVVMSFLNGTAITSDRNPFKIVDMNDLGNKNGEAIYQKKMADTLTKLLASGKRIIYVISNPYLNFDIKSCLEGYRPINLSDEPKKLCAMTRDDYFVGQSGGIYRKRAHEVLKSFPQVQVVDLAQPFCDHKYCWAEKDGYILFRDTVHLSIYGSKLVAPRISKLIQQDLAQAGAEPVPQPATTVRGP